MEFLAFLATLVLKFQAYLEPLPEDPERLPDELDPEEPDDPDDDDEELPELLLPPPPLPPPPLRF